MSLDNVNGYTEEYVGIKFLVFASTEKKEALKNYTKFWEEARRQIEVKIDDKSIK